MRIIKLFIQISALLNAQGIATQHQPVRPLKPWILGFYFPRDVGLEEYLFLGENTFSKIKNLIQAADFLINPLS